MSEHKIEFGPGEVLRPEFNPENDLVAVYVNDDGLESLREAVSPAQPSGSSGEDGLSHPELQGEPLDRGRIDLGMVLIDYEVRAPPEMRER